MNVRRTPKRILNAYPPDQRLQICSDPRPDGIDGIHEAFFLSLKSTIS
jgi:hypothetical protein